MTDTQNETINLTEFAAFLRGAGLSGGSLSRVSPTEIIATVDRMPLVNDILNVARQLGYQTVTYFIGVGLYQVHVLTTPTYIEYTRNRIQEDMNGRANG